MNIRGHEFHYSAPIDIPDSVKTCMDVRTGFGIGNNRDGFLYNNVLACYTHIHSDGVGQWAASLVRKAAEYKDRLNDERNRDQMRVAAGRLVAT